MNTSYLKHIFFVLTLVLLASCDNDFNEVGANVIGDENYLGEQEVYAVNAFNVGLGAVDSKNLPVAPLGIYNHPVFGQTTAHYATQVQLSEENPVINLALDPTINSVVLKIPYFSTLESDGLYTLDSISGPAASKLNLSIYESQYYMRDIDPVLGTAQSYYTDQNSDFTPSMAGPLLNNSPIASQNTEFKFDPLVQTDSTYTDEVLTTTTVAPAMKLHLNKSFFQNKLFGAGAAGQLVNNNLFKNYFRGLYFHVDKSGADAGQLAMMNFAGGTIVVTYTQNSTVPEVGQEPIKVTKTMTLKLTGNSVSLLENADNPVYASAVANANQTTGDDILYVKGGQGSMAVIELFQNKAELDEIRAKKWLVNDASLTFFVRNDLLNPDLPVESQRVFLYDLNNKRTLIDYSVDASVSASNTKQNKLVHGGLLYDRDETKRGTKYKVRITNYLQTLLKNADSTNVRLGLVVTENINVATNKKLRNQEGIQQNGDLKPFTIKEVPLMSVPHTFGTVLYGGGANVPEEKRLKLTVYYTKPN